MKFCGGCEQEKPLEDFTWRNKDKNSRASQCKECHKAYSRKYYKSNKERYLASNKVSNERLIERNRTVIIQHLSANPCIDCGESDIITLDFDHRSDKSFSISSRYYNVGTPRLLAEIAKCDVRCSNCHRKKTAKDFGYYKTRLFPI